MPRGDRWWNEPPTWAWIVMVVGVLILVVLTPLALEHGAGPAARDAAVETAERTRSSAAAEAPESTARAPSTDEAPADATLDDRFTDGAGRRILTAETGQPWTLVGDSDLQLQDRGLTIDGAGVGYAMTDLGVVPTRMGASVLFEPGAPGAVITMLVSAGPGPNLADLGVRYAFDAVGWTVQVRQAGESPPPTVAAGRFDPPLRTDGSTIYDAEVRIEGKTLTITGPDGGVVRAADRRIGANLSGNVGWGVLRPDDAQARPVISRVWATVS